MSRSTFQAADDYDNGFDDGYAAAASGEQSRVPGVPNEIPDGSADYRDGYRDGFDSGCADTRQTR